MTDKELVKEIRRKRSRRCPAVPITALCVDGKLDSLRRLGE